MLGVKPASKSNIAGKKSDPAGNLYYLLSVLYYIINQNILTLKSAEMKRCEVVSGGGGGREGLQILLSDFTSLEISIRPGMWWCCCNVAGRCHGEARAN